MPRMARSTLPGMTCAWRASPDHGHGGDRDRDRRRRLAGRTGRRPRSRGTSQAAAPRTASQTATAADGLTVVTRVGQHLDQREAAAGSPRSCRPCASARPRRYRAHDLVRAHHAGSPGEPAIEPKPSGRSGSPARLAPVARRGPGHADTTVPCPGADHTDACPPQSAVRSAMDRRRPSRAWSTRAGSKPAPRSRTVTCRRHGTLGIARRRRQANLHPGLPGPRVRGHVRQRLARGVRDRRGDPGRDGGRAARHRPRRGRSARGRACRRRRPAPRRPGRRTDARRPAAGSSGSPSASSIRATSCRHLLTTSASVIAAGPGQRGERVEDRVVQQALVLAAFDVPGQDGVLLAGGLVGLVQGGVRRRGAARRVSAGPKVCASPMTISKTAAPVMRPAVGHRLQRRAEPVGRRRDERQQHRERAGRVPGGDDELARHADDQPAERVVADLRAARTPGRRARAPRKRRSPRRRERGRASVAAGRP